MKKQSILVTGCAGFIGSNFVRVFKRHFPQYLIVGVDNFSTGRKEALDKKIKFYKTSISNKKQMVKVFKNHKPICVFHFAANPQIQVCDELPDGTSISNIIGTLTLLALSKKYAIKRFIYSSSASVYGNPEALPTSEQNSKPNPQSVYAIQKLTGEKMCTLYSQKFNLDTVSLRYFNVYGPGQYGNSAYSTVVSAWLESAFFPKNKKGFIEGDGSKTRDFCYVEDVVEANIKAFLKNESLQGAILNIGSGIQTSISEVRNILESKLNKQLDLEQRESRQMDIEHSCADITEAIKNLNYKPKTDIHLGIENTIKWYKSRKK